MSLLSETLWRAVLLGLAFLMALGLLILGVVAFGPSETERRIAKCSSLDEAPIEILGQNLSIPALKRTIIFAVPEDGYDLVRITPVLDPPWADAPYGFCAHDVAAPLESTGVSFSGEAATQLIRAMNLNLEGDLDRLEIGINGFGWWLGPGLLAPKTTEDDHADYLIPSHVNDDGCSVRSVPGSMTSSATSLKFNRRLAASHTDVMCMGGACCVPHSSTQISVNLNA